jgi:cupin 2 domain-containing protein
MSYERGRLIPAAEAPGTGERVAELCRGPGWRVEQILSGRLEAPLTDRLDHDEVAVVLAGGASLEVDGNELELAAGDWVLLRAGQVHRLVSTEPATSWLTVHVPGK